jgi:hypothetical protein
MEHNNNDIAAIIIIVVTRLCYFWNPNCRNETSFYYKNGYYFFALGEFHDVTLDGTVL